MKQNLCIFFFIIGGVECNFVVCAKLKQHLILGLDFAQRYKIRIDWDKIISKMQRQEDSLFEDN